MEKKIQDFLHLYIGCEAILTTNHWFTPEGDKKVIITGYFGGEYPYAFYTRGDNVSGNDQVKYFKPLLRPLSSMTEEEMLEYARIERPETSKVELKGEKVWSFYDDGESFYKWIAHSLMKPIPDQFRYLLSRGFDLFGLIDAGIAIDKTQSPH